MSRSPRRPDRTSLARVVLQPLTELDLLHVLATGLAVDRELVANHLDHRGTGELRQGVGRLARVEAGRSLDGALYELVRLEVLLGRGHDGLHARLADGDGWLELVAHASQLAYLAAGELHLSLAFLAWADVLRELIP